MSAAQEPEYTSLVPYSDTSHAGLLLAAEEARMRREHRSTQEIKAWLDEQHDGPRVRTNQRRRSR